MKEKNNKLLIRLIAYFGGLFIMTIGIAISVKSNLGVSPVSSIPYTATCVFGTEMGNATIIFHVALVLFQIIMIRGKFKWINVLQIPVGIVFGKFTTCCNMLVAVFPTPENLAVRIIMSLLSAALIALGIFFYIPANIMPMATEGAMQAISDVFHIKFSNAKISFDVSVVIISIVVCLIALHGLGSVGIGTIIAAVLVGIILGRFNAAFGGWRDELLAVNRNVEECK